MVNEHCSDVCIICGTELRNDLETTRKIMRHTDEVVSWVLLVGNEYLPMLLSRPVVSGWLVALVNLYQVLDEVPSFIEEFFSISEFARILTNAESIVHWRWGRGSFSLWRDLHLALSNVVLGPPKLLVFALDRWIIRHFAAREVWGQNNLQT